MPNDRRAFRPGGKFFFTLVTYGCTCFLCDAPARGQRLALPQPTPVTVPHFDGSDAEGIEAAFGE